MRIPVTFVSLHGDDRIVLSVFDVGPDGVLVDVDD